MRRRGCRRGREFVLLLLGLGGIDVVMTLVVL